MPESPNIDGTPKIEDAVGEKIDTKIKKAKLPTEKPLPNVPSTTTSEEDLEAANQREATALKTSGQRRVNLLWESTQAIIAVMITGAVIYSALNNIKSEILNTAFVLVISMYLVRTNHTKVGGVTGVEHR